MEFAGFTPSQYDVSLLEEKPVHFSITGGLDARGLLSQLALTYQFDVVPSGGTVKFVPKYQTPVRNLTYADLFNNFGKLSINPNGTRNTSETESVTTPIAPSAVVTTTTRLRSSNSAADK